MRAAFVTILLLSNVLARMKIWTQGLIFGPARSARRWRGQGVDSPIFYPVAFFGLMDAETIIWLGLTQWGLKVAWEAILTPVTYAVVGWLKRKEGVDVYDEGTDFTPFRAKV